MAPTVMRSILRAPSTSLTFPSINKRVTFADNEVIPPSVNTPAHVPTSSTAVHPEGIPEPTQVDVPNHKLSESLNIPQMDDGVLSLPKRSQEKEKEHEHEQGQELKHLLKPSSRMSLQNTNTTGSKGVIAENLMTESFNVKVLSARKEIEDDHSKYDSPESILTPSPLKRRHEPKKSESVASHSVSSARSHTNKHANARPRSRTRPRARVPTYVRGQRAIVESRVSKKRTLRSTRRSLMSVSSSPSIISEKAHKTYGKKVGKKHREDRIHRSADKNTAVARTNEFAQNDSKIRRVKKTPSFLGHNPSSNNNDHSKRHGRRKVQKGHAEIRENSVGDRISRKTSAGVMNLGLVTHDGKETKSSNDVYTVQVARSFVGACAQLSATNGILVAVDGKALYRMVSFCRRQRRHNRIRTPVELRSEGLRAMLIETEESMRLPSDDHEGRRDLRRRRSAIIKFARSEGQGTETKLKVASWESLQKVAVTALTNRIEQLIQRQGS